MKNCKDGLHPFGDVYYRIYSAEGDLIEEKSHEVPNKIVAGMIDNIVESFAAETSNPCSGYKYIGIGSGDTPVTVNDTELDNEFESGDFGGSEYTSRLSSYTGVDYSANTYTVSASITNSSDTTRSVAESGLFDSDTPGATANSNMGSRTVVGTAVDLEPDEKLEISWVWSVNSD